MPREKSARAHPFTATIRALDSVRWCSNGSSSSVASSATSSTAAVGGSACFRLRPQRPGERFRLEMRAKPSPAASNSVQMCFLESTTVIVYNTTCFVVCCVMEYVMDAHRGGSLARASAPAHFSSRHSPIVFIVSYKKLSCDSVVGTDY